MTGSADSSAKTSSEVAVVKSVTRHGPSYEKCGAVRSRTTDSQDKAIDSAGMAVDLFGDAIWSSPPLKDGSPSFSPGAKVTMTSTTL
jgi:hypothetical protein